MISIGLKTELDMLKKTLIVILSLIFSLTTFAGSAVSLPIKHELNSLIIIELNLHQDLPPYKFLLDTGSNVNFLNPDIARAMSEKKIFTFKDELNTNVTTYNSVIKSLGGTLNFTLQNLNFNDMTTNVMQNKRFQKELDGFDCCDGILGAPFLKKYPFLIDLEKNQFVLNANKSSDLKNILTFEIKGKDVIVLKCEKDGTNFSLRLDTGSEMPLTFHSNFVRDNRIYEKIYEANSVFAPSFVEFKKAFCGKLELETEAYLYTGKSGALSHEAIDGNLGPRILGKKYLINYEKNTIAILNSKTTIDLMGVMGINIDFFRNIGKKDILDRFEFMILKSCTENDKNPEYCYSRWCEIRGIKNCPIPASSKLEDMILAFHGKNFDQHCAYPQVIDMYTNANEILKPHPCQWKKYLSDKKPNATNSIQVKDLAYPLPHELNIDMRRTVNQELFTQNFYCYGVKEKLFKKQELPLDLFSLSIKGISFSKLSYDQFISWSKSTQEGKKCINELKSFLNIDEIQKITLEPGKTHGLVINEITLLGDGSGPKGGDVKNGLTDKYYENFLTTLNHERLHLLYANDPTLKKALAEKIKNLTPEFIENFKKEHPSYNFSDPDIFAREFFSYSYEKNMGKIFEDYPIIKK